jgi:prolyl-tRNA editing enzyme YbaK/EbsC (Cys-tRNA(Pro) deacylase)
LIGCAGTVARMWPEPVERIATLLRATGAEARLEELPAGVDSPPGTSLVAVGFECDSRGLVALIPADREVDREKLARLGSCTTLRPGPSPAFPFEGARFFLERTALSTEILWLEAGSPRHVVGMTPSQLARITRLETADLLLED